MAHKEELEATKAGQDASINTFVSIYLLLLAFFVVLNAISNQRVAKAGAVLESLNSAFQRQFAPPASVLDIISEPRAVAPTDEFLAEVRGLLASVFDVDANFPTTGGNLLEVEMPVSQLFEPGSVALKPEIETFLERFSELAVGGQPGERREVEFQFSAEPDEVGDNLRIRRAGRLARLLESRAVPATSIAVALKDGAEGTVTVAFRSLEESRAALTFAELAPEEPGQ